MSTTTTERVLPADVYDTLEFSALAYGGIGAEWTVDGIGDPLCAIGHASRAENVEPYEATALVQALWNAGVTGDANDEAVWAINKRKRRNNLNGRVSFQEWCRELGIVRGWS